jgi:hypothetical protein
MKIFLSFFLIILVLEAMAVSSLEKNFNGNLTQDWLTEWGFNVSTGYMNLASKGIINIEAGLFEIFNNVEYLNLESNQIDTLKVD